MKSTKDYIMLLKDRAHQIQSDFGVTSLRLFGSVSRGEHHEGSDVDVCVEMQPNMFKVVRLQRYLEDVLGTPVDVIRMHSHINPYLLKEIEKDGINVI